MLISLQFMMLRLCVRITANHSHHKWPSVWLPIHNLHTRDKDYSVYFEELGLPNPSDEGAVRDAFIKLAKQYHPDTGSNTNTEKFHRVEHSYRKLLEKFSNDRWNKNKCEGEYGLYYEQKKKWRDQKEKEEEEEEEEEEKDYGIKHTAPQHRQYLSYEGIGYGTPSQRQKQYTKVKAQRAASSVGEYRVRRINESHPETSLVDKDRREARKIRTRYGIDRIVDDVIQEAMARGEFDNLSMAGQPLPQRTINPYVDTTTHKLNEHLINNGFAPEWVVVEKEVRTEREKVRQKLRQARSTLGPLPLTQHEQVLWSTQLDQLRSSDIKELNTKINKLNLIVPLLTQQMTHYPLKREAERILKEGETKEDVERRREEEEREESAARQKKNGIFVNIIGLFKRNRS